MLYNPFIINSQSYIDNLPFNPFPEQMGHIFSFTYNINRSSKHLFQSILYANK